MSAYTEQKTQINDAECLKKALAEKGYTADKVEEHEQAVPLVDFTGKQTKYTDPAGDKANIVIRRRHVGGAANDVGFLKQKDGTYSAMISAYDKGKHNAAWMADLKKRYAIHKISKVAKQNGMSLLKKEETKNGGYRFQFLKA